MRGIGVAVPTAQAEARPGHIERVVDMCDVGVVILTYENTEDTIECVDSVLASEFRGHISVCVVDNGSSQQVRVELRGALATRSAHLIELQRNRGFSAGMNVGIASVLQERCDYILVLNNDVALDRHAVAKLVECARKAPDVGIVSPKILLYHDRSLIWWAGSKRGIKYAVHRGLGERDSRQYDALEDIPFATGCAMLLPRNAIERGGAFDERFFFGMEDRELSDRYRMAGLRLVYAPEALVYHKVAVSRRRVAANPEWVYVSYLTQFFYLKSSRGMLAMAAWMAVYAVYLMTAWPMRELGRTRSSLGANWRSAWRAWVDTWTAKRVPPPRRRATL